MLQKAIGELCWVKECTLQCYKGWRRLEDSLLIAAKQKNMPSKGSAGLPMPLKHKLPGSSSSVPPVEPCVLCPGSC